MKRIIRKIIPRFLISCYHFSLAFLGAVLYRFPSRKLKVIGITGTNGKTTVADLATRILEEAGIKVASVSSIRFKIGEEERINKLKMTMPGRLKLQRFLRKAVKKNCQYAVLEVTSEGILQHRHRFIYFDVAVFTNLTPEHIENHGSFDNYKKAKGELFRALNGKGLSIINLDDKNADYFLGFPAGKKIGYGIDFKERENIETIRASETDANSKKISFSVNNFNFNLQLPGRFNIYNALASIVSSKGISFETCQKAFDKINNVPGRMEEVISEPFRVFVDYAHTTDALLNVYSSLPKKTRKICVLGSCGGTRDKWKRPEIGKIAARFCDEIILTNEDPYDEDPNQIISQIESGIGNKKSIRVLDRREAIKKALTLARPGDIVIITGKGSEPWMCVARGKKIAWDDRKIAKEEFSKK